MPQPLQLTIHPLYDPRDVNPWLDSAPDWEPLSTSKSAAPPGPAWLDNAPDWTPELEAQIKRGQPGIGDAASRGFLEGATFGFGPAIAGAWRAGQDPNQAPPDEFSNLAGSAGGDFANLVRGFSRLIRGDPAATQAYQHARDEERQLNERAYQQHPYAYMGGELGSALATPLPGLRGGALIDRLAQGAAVGGATGGLYGIGQGVSAGQSPEQIASSGLTGAVGGAAIGGALGGILGPRARAPVPLTPGQRAAETAAGMGTPLPRGLASDRPGVQATTSKLRSFPFVGSKISDAVEAINEAAGNRIENLAAGRRGTAPNRALAGSVLRSALEEVKAANNDKISQAYDVLERVTDTGKFASLKNTKAALEGIRSSRRGSRKSNVDAGLEDVVNMIYGGKGGTSGGGIRFDHLQRARSDYAQKMSFFNQDANPGMTMPELRRLYGAMSSDMEAAVRKYAKINPDQAANVLRRAHDVAKEFIGRNATIQRVLNIKNDEQLVGSLMTAAQEKTGNLHMLRELRSSMDPEDFHHIAGTMLWELGHSPANPDEFSLAKFVTGWNKISDGAKQVMFSPQHLADINDIFGLGKHIKRVLKESNVGKSETAGPLILFETIKDAVLGTMAFAAGGVGVGGAAAGASAVGSYLWARYLANPVSASAMAKWNRARIGLTAQPTPARVAAFNVATRNLSNNLGIPAQRILQITSEHIPGQGRAENDNPRPVNQKPYSTKNQARHPYPAQSY